MTPSKAPPKNPPPLGVVILAAGASSRMGRPKLLLPWQDTTVIGHIILQWQELGASQIVVVHRPNDVALLAELADLNVDRVENPQPEHGMFSSIQRAASWGGRSRDIQSHAIVLGDQPHLHLDTLRSLLEFHALHGDAICQPLYGGHERHPVILPRGVFDALKTSKAETLKDFLKLISCPAVQYPLEDAGLALDMDTPEDYNNLKHLTSAR